MKFQPTNATYLLMFLETCKNNNIVTISLEYSLEHIFPQSRKGDLKIDNINKLGNLTIYEQKNSDNGHKGNSGLGSKDYQKKKEFYSKSSSLITREISEIFKGTKFMDEEIEKRTTDLFKELHVFTNYE